MQDKLFSNRKFLIDRLPKRGRVFAYKLLIKLGIIKQYGHFEVIVTDKDGKKTKAEGYNILTNVGINQLGDVMIGVGTVRTINYLNVGTGTTTPAVGDTELAAPAAGTTIPTVTTRARSNQTLTFSLNISSSMYTRPVTLAEIAVYYTGAGGADGVLFARGLLGSTVILAASATATVTYGVLLR